MDELLIMIADALTIELQGEDSFNADVLMQKVKGAIRDVITARRYPATYSEEKKLADLNNYYQNILDIARYDYNTFGAEGQQMSSENGITRQWVNRRSLFYGILPIARRS